MLATLKKFIINSYKVIFYILEIGFVLMLSILISIPSFITWTQALLVVILAIVLDIQNEVDGISRTRRYIENLIKDAMKG